MKNLKLELFNFKNNLHVDQLDEAKIAQKHLENFEYLSEVELYNSLKENLSTYTYDNFVKLFLESIEEELDSKPLVYELKDLYKKVERKNLGELYRQSLVTLLEIINKNDDDSRMTSILNELAIYDWVPEIKHFLMKVTSSPIERQNLQNSGKAAKIYTLVEKVDEGNLAYVVDRWFLISENEIKQVVADDYVKDAEKIRNIRLLEKVLEIAEIGDDRLSFVIDENLTIGLSTSKKELYLNDDKLDSETTLETLFKSPIVPYIKKEYYVLIESALNNINKFVELDIALRVTNLLNPFTESVVFNFKDKMYMYSKDRRTGSRFYAYENASEIIHDIQKELDYDLTHFYENKLSKELKTLRTLTDREQQINMKLQDVNESVAMLNADEKLLKENAELRNALRNVLVIKNELLLELNKIKTSKAETRKLFIK